MSKKQYSLNTQIRGKIAKYAESNVISGKVVADILRASTNEELIEAISSMYDLSSEKQSKIWYYIVTGVWKNDDKDTWFSETENIFMRELMFNKGILKKTACMKIRALFTEHKTNTTAQNLQDMGLIDIFSVNREIMYVLSRDFYEEAMNYGNGN